MEICAPLCARTHRSIRTVRVQRLTIASRKLAAQEHIHGLTQISDALAPFGKNAVAAHDPSRNVKSDADALTEQERDDTRAIQRQEGEGGIARENEPPIA